MKLNKTMKRWIFILITALAIFLTADLCAQERGVKFAGGTDLVSTYVWRGVYESGPAFQPTLTLTTGNFSATAWGSVDFDNKYKEMDLTLAYTLGPVTLSVADLYWTGHADDRYFRFDNHSPHRIEVGASWVVSERVPVTLSWYTILFGGLLAVAQKAAALCQVVKRATERMTVAAGCQVERFGQGAITVAIGIPVRVVVRSLPAQKLFGQRIDFPAPPGIELGVGKQRTEIVADEHPEQFDFPQATAKIMSPERAGVRPVLHGRLFVVLHTSDPLLKDVHSLFEQGISVVVLLHDGPADR